MTMLYIYLAGSPHFINDLGKGPHRLVSALTGDSGKVHVFEGFLISFVLFNGQKNPGFAPFRIRDELNVLDHGRHLTHAQPPQADGS